MGLLRFLLAAIVVLFHLGGAGMLSGRMGVMGFYVISGFLITGVLHQKYGTTKGRLLFIVNRFLRLIPLYFLVSVLSYACYAWVGAVPVNAASPDEKWIPGQATLNLLIPMPSLHTSSFGTPLLLGGSGAIPQGWSVSVELSFYAFALIAAFVNLRMCLQVAFAVSFSLFILSVTWMDSFSSGYENGIYKDAFSTLWLFAVGGLTYFYRSRRGHLSTSGKSSAALAGLGLLVLGLLSNIYLGELLATSGPYWKYCLVASHLATAAAVVAVLVTVPSQESSFSKQLGDLSYGVYLNHFLVAWALLYIATIFSVPVFGRLNTLGFGVVALFASTAAAHMMHKHIDLPIQRIRDRIRRMSR